jgi:hypothetical protein
MSTLLNQLCVNDEEGGSGNVTVADCGRVPYKPLLLKVFAKKVCVPGLTPDKDMFGEPSAAKKIAADHEAPVLPQINCILINRCG